MIRSRILRPTAARLGAFRRDERGSITVEFVLWVPLLGFWFALSAATFDAYKSRNEAAKAANTIVDIVTRAETVDDAFLDNLHLLQERLLPRVHAGERLRISSILFEDGVHSVQWSRAMGGGEALIDDFIPVAALPTVADGDTLILTEVFVPWDPIMGEVGLDATSWSFTIVARPRFVDAIVKTDAGT